MTWEFVVIFLMVDLSGSKMLVILMEIQSVKIFQQDIFLKLILKILMNYTNCTIIHYLLKKLAIPYEILSDYCKKIADGYGIKIGDVKKLVPSLGNKTNYVLQ